MKKVYLLFLLALLPFVVYADPLEINGIYYNLDLEAKTAEVTKNPNWYSGDVVIPKTVTYGGKKYSVTSIGEWAFYDCRNLTSVVIPNSVTSIGNGAFAACSSLTTIKIPNSVTSVGSQAFDNTPWYNNQPDGIVYADNILYKYKGTMPDDTEITIKEGTLGIAGSAFQGCAGLTSVTIPSSVTFIGNNAFSVCKNLTSVTIPNSVRSIGSGAFNGCSGLTSITIPASVTSIGFNSFRGCSGLTSVTIPNSVTSIDYGAFSGCSGLTSVVIPNSVISIGDKVFNKCSQLASIDIPNSVSSIGTDAFLGTPWYDNQPEGVVYAGKVLYKFKGTMPDGTKIQIEDGTLGIAGGAFRGCAGLNSVTIPSSVISIGDNAFSSCSALASLAIPTSVTSIGESTFYYCSALTSITIPNSVTSIGDNAFSGCSALTSITIPNSVTFLGSNAFGGCSGLTSIKIPVSVTSISEGAFSGCSGLTSIIVEESNTAYYSRNCNAIIETASNMLIAGCINTTIPNGVTSIGSGAFSGCSGLTSITIPASVTSIGSGAFYGCSGLTSITIPNGVSHIDLLTTGGCSGLKSITIGNGLTRISAFSFVGSGNVTDVYCYAETVPDIVHNTLDWRENDHYLFGHRMENTTLYVPAGSVDAYKANSEWNDNFKEILPIAESASITIGGKGLTTYTSKYNLDFSGFGDEVKAYVATGYDYDTKTIWLTRVKDAPAGTALMVKGAAGKTYEVPVKQTSGSYYKNMFVGNTTGSDMALSETSDGMTNYYLKDGEFKSVKGSAKINDGKSYLQIPTTAPTAKAGSSQTMTMNAYGFASYCGSQDLDFTDVEGLKAYAATGYDDATGIIWLTRVMRVSAGTPLLLMGAPSTEDKVSSYTVPSSAVSSYYTNMLKGNTGTEDLIINTTEGDMTNYYLKGNQLLKVSGTAKIHPGKAYMQIPTRHVTRAEEDVVSGAPYYNIGEEPEVISMQIGTRGIDGDDADTTGISEVKSDDADRGEWYNLQGQRVGNPGKGLYIKNGKKVIVR